MFDSGDSTMFVKSQGVCYKGIINQLSVYASISYDALTNVPVPASVHYISSGLTTVIGASGYDISVVTGDYGYTDFGFIELPAAGIFQAGTINNNLPEFINGTFFGYLAGGDIAPLRYLVVSTTPGTPSGSYGFQLMDSSGAVTFDSRYKTIGVQDAIYISKAQFQDVVYNNSVINFPLSGPAPNCLVYMPFWANIRMSQYYLQGVCSVKLTQLNDTTLQLSRFAETAFSMSNPYSYEYWHDAIILVARNILI